MAIKTKEMILARRAANNARIDAANARAGKTSASMAAEREQIRARHAASASKVQSTGTVSAVGAVSAPKPVVQAKARPAARRTVAAAPKKAAPVVAPAQNSSQEIMSREVPNRKMVDRVYGLKTTPVRKSSWNWSL